MKFKIVSAFAAILLAAGLVYGYSLYTSTDCCAEIKDNTKASCTKDGATTTAQASIAPAPEAMPNNMTEEEIKACAVAHGVSVEECIRTCALNQPAANTCQKGEAAAGTACCKK